MNRQTALAKFLEVSKNELKQGYNKVTFELGDQEYLILTDKEADKFAKDYILDSVWAFNFSFVRDYLKIDLEAEDWKILTEKCESANNLVLSMIKNKKEFVTDAIGTDGRGHFISGYDGRENEFDKYFIYRLN